MTPKHSNCLSGLGCWWSEGALVDGSFHTIFKIYHMKNTSFCCPSHSLAHLHVQFIFTSVITTTSAIFSLLSNPPAWGVSLLVFHLCILSLCSCIYFASIFLLLLGFPGSESCPFADSYSYVIDEVSLVLESPNPLFSLMNMSSAPPPSSFTPKVIYRAVYFHTSPPPFSCLSFTAHSLHRNPTLTSLLSVSSPSPQTRSVFPTSG